MMLSARCGGRALLLLALLLCTSASALQLHSPSGARVLSHETITPMAFVEEGFMASDPVDRMIMDQLAELARHHHSNPSYVETEEQISSKKSYEGPYARGPQPHSDEERHNLFEGEMGEEARIFFELEEHEPEPATDDDESKDSNQSMSNTVSSAEDVEFENRNRQEQANTPVEPQPQVDPEEPIDDQPADNNDLETTSPRIDNRHDDSDPDTDQSDNDEVPDEDLSNEDDDDDEQQQQQQQQQEQQQGEETESPAMSQDSSDDDESEELQDQDEDEDDNNLRAEEVDDDSDEVVDSSTSPANQAASLLEEDRILIKNPTDIFCWDSNDCSGHGNCLWFKCYCFRGFYGSRCEKGQAHQSAVWGVNPNNRVAVYCFINRFQQVCRTLKPVPSKPQQLAFSKISANHRADTIALTVDRRPYVRLGTSFRKPIGHKWKLASRNKFLDVTSGPLTQYIITENKKLYFNYGKCDSPRWSYIAYGFVKVDVDQLTGSALWALHSNGYMYFRHGVKNSNPKGNKWARFTKKLPGGVKSFTVGRKLLWAVSKSNLIYVTQWKPSASAAQHKWRRVGGMLLSISSDRLGNVWGIGVGRGTEVWMRQGVTFSRPLGTSWKLAPVRLADVDIGAVFF